VTLTQSKKNILIKRVRAGRSIKEIAAEFKVTKNSISGHINRLRGLYGDELKCAQQSTYARAPKVTEDKSPKDIATQSKQGKGGGGGGGRARFKSLHPFSQL
jgi:transposase